MAVVSPARGRHATTHWRVEESFDSATLVACRLETGRTHQIRVHLASIGHPLLGDSVYGGGFKTKASLLSDNARQALAALGRQALHAAVLGFEHPITGENLLFKSAPPEDFENLIKALRGNGACGEAAAKRARHARGGGGARIVPRQHEQIFILRTPELIWPPSFGQGSPTYMVQRGASMAPAGARP